MFIRDISNNPKDNKEQRINILIWLLTKFSANIKIMSVITLDKNIKFIYPYPLVLFLEN